MINELNCWKCGVALKTIRQPLLRRAECAACRAELHVCRMCTLYNPRISDRCDEPKAEHPLYVDRANFCDYFKPNANAYGRSNESKVQAAKSKLDALFGNASAEEETSATEARKKLDDLFRPGGDGE